MKRLLWISPEKSGGIQTYTEHLWPHVQKILGNDTEGKIIQDEIRSQTELQSSIKKTLSFKPDIIHVQHEFGLFGGSKLPHAYCFPQWVRQIKAELPDAKIVATAHTVIDSNFTYPTKARGWKAPLLWLANQTIVPSLRKTWMQGTWEKLDTVFVHSETQVQAIRHSKCEKAYAIPHFVLGAEAIQSKHPVLDELDLDRPTVLVFGYFTPPKGQDLAIHACAKLNQKINLILAGEARIKKDQIYLEHCKKLVKKFQLEDQVRFTSYVETNQIPSLFSASDIALAPFRETHGSGSITYGFTYKKPVITSDLPICTELNRREKDSVLTFKTDQSEDLAQKIQTLLEDKELRSRYATAGYRYAETHSPERIAAKHVEHYQALCE